MADERRFTFSEEESFAASSERREKRIAEAEGPGVGETAAAVGAELVKSYGFARSSDGEWSWSTDNIVKAFKDQPFWATLDYVTLAMPVAKWGVAAKHIMKGSIAPARAYRAGDIGFRKAVSLAKQAPASTTVGRGLSSPLTQRFDSEYTKLFSKFEPNPDEVRGILATQKTELILQQSAIERTRDDLMRGFSGLNEGQSASVTRFLEGGLSPGDEIIEATLGAKGAKAYARTFDFRNALHEEAYRLKLINRETYERNYKNYAPRIYKEFIEAEEGAFIRTGMVRSPKEELARFKGRTGNTKDLTRIWDAEATVNELMKAANVVSKQNFAQNLGSSVIAKSADDLLPWLGQLDPGMLKINRISPAIGEHAREMMAAQEAGETISDVAKADLLNAAGWRKMESFFPGKELPDYLKRLPDDLKNAYLDPAVAKDVFGMMKFADDPSFIQRFYQNTLNLFRIGKTALNPATQSRNYFGNVLFHHMATGGIPTLGPRKGLQAWLTQSDDYVDAVKSGIVGSSFDKEIRDMVERIYGKGAAGKASTTPFDFLGNSKIAELLQSGSAKAQRFYSEVDAIWKIDAFVVLKKKAMKAGLSKEKAIEKAVFGVNSYMPSFLIHSPFTEIVKGHIPFASFSTEALRVWKNAMTNKPHIALFWQHFGETMSTTFGALAGHSFDDVDKIQSRLPDYTKGKQMMMLPFNVDGKPHFLDLSYMIPMGNMGTEVQDAKNLFFGAPIDIGSNPFFSAAAAFKTGKDVFSGREIEPKFTERHLGIPVEGERARFAVGLAEHMMATMFPPLAPPGYSGINLLEVAKGSKHPGTGMELEPSMIRTVAANIGGMRTYEATVEAQLRNIQRDKRLLVTERGQSWDRYEYAMAQGDTTTMRREEQNIVDLTDKFGDNGSKYFSKNSDRHIPGGFANVSTKQIRETLALADEIGVLSEDDKKLQSLLFHRLRKRSTGRGGRSKRKSRSKKRARR